MEYVVYLIACVMCIIVIHRVKKAALAKGYKRGVCSVVSGVAGFFAFFFVIVAAASLGLIKPRLPESKPAESVVVKPTPQTIANSDIPQ
jgi:hypothetical protein